jgi:hypothetical protein
VKREEFHVGTTGLLSIDEYHASAGISKSGLDSLNQSPAIYHARHVNPDRPPREEKAGQLAGNLAHCAILEPAEFTKRYVVGEAINRNTNKWKDFVQANVGRIAIQPDQYEQAMRQADSVRSLPEVREALELGIAEPSAFWIDPETGAECRCRPDWVHFCGDASAVLFDVKTYSNASPAEFRRQIARKRYHVQDAFYSDGWATAARVEVLGFVFVAVEDEWPYAANAVMLSEESKELGRHTYYRNLMTYMECLKSGEWPGYSKGIDIVNLPAWAFNQVED